MHQHTTNQTAAQRLRRLKALVAERANTEWGQKEIEDELAQDPDSRTRRVRATPASSRPCG